ncbi:MAG: hypothetical protein ACK5UI_06165 [Bacteroidota bacterium]|jgi:hypothetical protein
MKLIQSKLVVVLLLFGFVLIYACSNTSNSTVTGLDTLKHQQHQTSLDTAEDCAKPTKYPNQDKPMALMMRQMADNAQKMKDKLEKGEQITGEEFPFIRFHLVEPTDPNVLQPQFYENARLFQEAHKVLINGKKGEQKELYTAYINQCINCHQTYCSGPLKRIRKLTLTQ